MLSVTRCQLGGMSRGRAEAVGALDRWLRVQGGCWVFKAPAVGGGVLVVTVLLVGG